MSDHQEKREQLKQQILGQIQTLQETVESLSDEELESVAGGMMMTPGVGHGMNINTGAMMPGVGANTGVMMPGVGYGMNAGRGAMMLSVGPARSMDHIE